MQTEDQTPSGEEKKTEAPEQNPLPGDPTAFLDELERDIGEQQNTATEQPVPEEEKKEETFQRENIEQNTTVKLDPFTQGTNNHRPETLLTPSVPAFEMFKRLKSAREDEVGRRENAKEWAETTFRSLEYNSYEASGDRVLANMKKHWTQNLSYGNFNIGPSGSRPTFEEGAILTGEQALAATRRHLGLGGNFTNVLPHSGIWLTLKPPLEETIIELYRQYNNIKTTVGRSTYGLLLSSYTGLVNELFTRFALSSMARNSVKDVDNILKIISIHDIDIIIWMYVCTMYPNGFNHKAPCIADPTKCTHIVADLINVRRLFFFNQKNFTPDELKHLTSNSQASMTLESIEKFKASRAAREEKTITLCEGTEDEVKFILQVPSAFEYFESTNRWINTIGSKVIEALGVDSTFNDRNNLITEHATATQMRKYSHWVKEIRVANGRIVSREDIESNLDLMSTSIQVRTEFDEKIQNYVEETRDAVIGIPDFKCPSCGKYQITEEHTDPLKRSIVAIDVVHTFFTILVQRAQLLME